jgi:hypothetical protein
MEEGSPMHGTWHPIETAQRRSAIIYDPKLGVCEGLRDSRGLWIAAAFNGQVKGCAPTHWTPLPEPPDGKANQRDVLYEALERALATLRHTHDRLPDFGADETLRVTILTECRDVAAALAKGRGDRPVRETRRVA